MSHYMTALAMRQTGLKPAAKVVLYWLADHHNGETGRCFPSLKRLAELCEMDKATVIRHLDALEHLGLVCREHRKRENGSQTTTEYRLKIGNAPVEKCDRPCSKTQQAPVEICDPLNLGTSNLGSEQDANASCARAPEPDHFEAFWQQYPHRGGARKGKATARKAWDKAIKARTSPEQIIGGAMRYAGDAQVLRGYAKDPATWINAKGWQDDVEQERPAAAGPTRGRGDARARAFLAAADATPAMDFGPGAYPSQPLLAGR